MYVLDGTVLSPDRAFTHPDTGVQYPANWLRLSTTEEKEAIGIEILPDPPVWDQRFYVGYDADGNLIPRDHAELVEVWTLTTRTTANTLLAPSDWMIVREADNGTAVKADWKTWRQSIRTTAEQKVADIAATATTDELAAYVTTSAYATWPDEPGAPVIAGTPASDGV